MNKIFFMAIISMLSFSAYSVECIKAREPQRAAIANQLCTSYKKIYYTDTRFKLESCLAESTVNYCGVKTYVIFTFKRTNNEQVACNAYVDHTKLVVVGGIDCGDE
jgi:hypothetical protein